MKAMKFSATWCGPCKMLSKVLEREQINVEEIDIDANRELTVQYEVRGVPTIVIVDDAGVETQRFVGAQLTPAQLNTLRAIG